MGLNTSSVARPEPLFKVLKSSDGTDIYAEVLGNPSKPPLVLIHGFSVSSIAFDTMFEDPSYLDHFYMVSDTIPSDNL